MEPEVKLLQFIIESIVENTSAVKIERKEDEYGIFLLLTVSKDDMGRVIGKNGQTVQSIRTILKLIGAKQKQRITFKVVEPEEV